MVEEKEVDSEGEGALRACEGRNEDMTKSA